MNISKFFIDRPIFAGVLSTLIFLGGLLALPAMPISEYPEVVPPQVVVRANYPGANPKVIAETVATPIEEQINGVEGMLYMSSQATTDGLMTLTVTFRLGTDPDKAQQLVQNRVSQAEPRLPDVVRTLGITTVKSSPDLTMVVHLLSPNNRYDMTYLRNYAVINVKDRLARIDGVGDVQLFGSGDYSMRVWVDPAKAAELGLSASDIVNAVRAENVQAAVGVVGSSPSLPNLDFQLSVNAQGRLASEEEFGDIVVKAGANNQVTRLRDVARIELGAADYSLRSLLDNKQAVAIPIFQSPGSNAIQISDNVRATMAELKQYMPEGVDYRIVYDPTQFVRASIEAVIHTLLEAVALVVLVVILFLQTWRASIIPLIAVPVSIIGTFAVMHVFGFSINALTLFGLVLAIGIVVDDAIVVVENVERNIESGLPAARSDYPGHARSFGADRRHRARAGRGVRTARPDHGSDGPVLQAVCADDRDLDGDLGGQLADAIACPRGRSAERPRRAEGLADTGHGLCVRLVLQEISIAAFSWGSDRLQRRRSAAFGAQGYRLLDLPRSDRRHCRPVQGGARGLRARAGQAISRRLRAASRWCHARSHGGCHSPDERDHLEDAGRRECGCVSGPVDQRFYKQLELRHRLRDAEALCRAAIRRP